MKLWSGFAYPPLITLCSVSGLAVHVLVSISAVYHPCSGLRIQHVNWSGSGIFIDHTIILYLRSSVGTDSMPESHRRCLIRQFVGKVEMFVSHNNPCGYLNMTNLGREA